MAEKDSEAAAPVAEKKSSAPDSKGRGGTAGIFAGVAVIAPVLIRELSTGAEPFYLLPFSLIALAIALSGFKVAQGGAEGKPGRIGLIVAQAGIALVIFMLMVFAYKDLAQNTRLQSGIWLINIGFLALMAGILLLGAVSLKAGVLARGPVLMMMLALPVGVLLDVSGAFPGLQFRWGPSLVLGQGMHYGLKVFGLALIWLGYTILRDAKARSLLSTEVLEPV